MLDFLKNYDKYEYCKGRPARFIGGLAVELVCGAALAGFAILLACIGYHFFLVL